MGTPDNDEETEYYTFSPPVYSRTSSVSSSYTGHDDLNSSSRSVSRWKNALRKIQSVDLDPWRDFPLESSSTQTAYRHRYSAIKKKWVVDEILIKMEVTPFDHGAMRECFRLKKHPQQSSPSNDWAHASNYVAKRYISAVDKQVYFDDVRLQMEAKLWAEAFNRQNPPKKVDIFQLSVLEIRDSNDLVENESSKDQSLAPPAGFYHIERYMEGEYRKYNSNSGFVDEQLRNTPQAFSHFTFERSGHRLLVVDIQGVGDLYTDPQIHTSDGVGYSDGNLGPRGMALFFHSHRCNPLCEWLGLTPFDLSASEIELQSQSVPKPAEDDVQNKEKQDSKQKNIPLAGHKFVRRRTVSFNNHSKNPQSPLYSHGPTIARSTENTIFPFSKPRRRCASSSTHDEPLHASSNSMDAEISLNLFSNLSLNKDKNTFDHRAIPGNSAAADLIDSLYVTQSASTHVRPLLALDILPARNHFPGPRNRALSGDSGYSGRLNPATHLLTQHSVTELPSGHNDLGDHLNDFENPILASTSSLGDLPSPMSPVITMATHPVLGASASGSLLSPADDIHDAFPSQASSIVSNYAFSRPGIFPRRQRNPSESSDIDAEENYRLAGNLLHQLMHESHKPSCADHPSNLDQEIGQSILGQIHHELARLHEAGRFLPSCKGGWSPGGLGGLLKQHENIDEANHLDAIEQKEVNGSKDESQLTDTDNEPGVDWASVLFHERHAAQLGCLEAIIVMAHYYLGLPTQLLFDCPIKPNEGELRIGIDYLWRGAEGGDRRCMILLAWYLDVSVGLVNPSYKPNRITTPNDLLIFPTLHSLAPEILNAVLPSISSDSWLESIGWYKRAVETATPDANNPDEGLDAEGGYDAAEDLLPVYRILARMAEMYSTGGFGLEQNYSMAGDLFSQAGESASNVHQGRLAAQYFELADKAYASVTE